LGGHDHLYYVSRGVTTWDNYDLTQTVLGAESDLGDILVVKSGSDFRDFTELKLVLEHAPQGSVRNQVICEIAGNITSSLRIREDAWVDTIVSGKRHTIETDTRSSEAMTNLLKTLLSSVSSTLKAPVCKATVTLDLRSYYIRTAEVRYVFLSLLKQLNLFLQSPAANWFADVVRHAYDDALCMKGCGGADGVLICAGTLRGDSTYGPGIYYIVRIGLNFKLLRIGPITLGDILEILPFEDPIIVVELDGATLWDAIESSLGMWPAQEG
jgi:5'-nucleotidase